MEKLLKSSLWLSLVIILTACGSDDNVVATMDPNELVIPETGYSTPLSYDNMTLVWQDEFDDATLNTDDWNFENGDGVTYGLPAGWGNNELQFYTEDNLSLVDGHLVIEAKFERRSNYNYTSSRITTEGKQSFKYGRIDVRAALPIGQGLWPAIWMLGANNNTIGWPKSGEIDIAELFGGTNAGNADNVVRSTVHWYDQAVVDAGSPLGHAEFGGNYTLEEGTFNQEFHVFSIIWDASKIIALVDDNAYFTVDITGDQLTEFQEEFYFLLNVAVGGNRVGDPTSSTRLPQRMIVDYIRVFQTTGG